MSIQHVGAVLHEMSELRDRTAAFALAVIADSADRRTGWTFDFTMREIAKFARQSLRGARDRVRFLEANGYIKTKLSGRAGRERMRFRVLFDFTGKRRTEAELYPPAKPAGVGRTPPAKPAAPPAGFAGPPAGNDHLLNNPLIGDPSSSVSIRKDVQKHARPKTKKMPAAESDSQRRDRIEQERKRQLTALGVQ